MKRILSLLSVLLCFAFLGCVEEYKPEECDPEKDWKLVIRGEDIGYIKYNEGYRDNKEDKYLGIPLVVVFEKL